MSVWLRLLQLLAHLLQAYNVVSAIRLTGSIAAGDLGFRCPARCWCELPHLAMTPEHVMLSVACNGKGLAVVPTELDPATVDLNLDENLLVELPDYLAASTPRLRVLSASRNTITKLNRRLFAALPQLVELRLSHNRIQHLDANDLSNCLNLRVLDVSHNQLSVLPFDLLDRLPAWLDVNFSYNRLLIVTSKFSTAADSSLKSAVMTARELNRDTRLDLSHNLLNAVEKNFRWPVASCPAVLDLSGNPALSYSGAGALKPLLKSVSADCHLEELQLRRVGLARLPVYAFRGRDLRLHRLRRLSLASNAIVTVEDGALSSLTQLAELNLSDNRLTDMPNLADLRGLWRLDLSHNLLTSFIDPTRLPTELRWLSLSRNSLHNLHPSVFARFLSLQSLDLRDNGLKDFRPIKRHIGGLTELLLGGNELRREHLDGIFAASPNLIRLDLSRNRISQIADNLTGECPHLRFLNLSWNGFPQIEPLDLGARQLEELDMTGNRLQILADYGSAGLRKLHVGVNNISTIDALAFKHSTSVQLLDLSDNPMEARTLALFKSSLDRLSGSLRVFKLNRYEIFAYLKNNNWGLFRDFHELEELELSRCNIRQPPGPAVVFPSSLRRLALDYNPIRAIDSDAFRSASHLRDLSIQSARISSVSAEAMRSLISVRRINLLGNPLRCDCGRLRHFWRWSLVTNVSVVGLHSRRLRCAAPAALRDRPVLDLQLARCESQFSRLPAAIAVATSLVILLVAALVYAALCRGGGGGRGVSQINQSIDDQQRCNFLAEDRRIAASALNQPAPTTAAAPSSTSRSRLNRLNRTSKCIIEV